MQDEKNRTQGSSQRDMLFFIPAVLVLAAMICFIVMGFPPHLGAYGLHLKNLRTPFVLFLVLALAAAVLPPGRKERILRWKKKIDSFSSRPAAVWILFGVYAVLFTWQQVSEYLAVEINFIPFSFYDYMLYYLFEGRLNFTGLLHGFYHMNNIMVLFAPLWWLVKSPLILVALYGVLAALPVFPLCGIARRRFVEPVAPLVIAFTYLNCRYLQNVLLMNFSVEIFYPFLILAALYSAMKKSWLTYYVWVILGLLVKEDSFIYFSALGLLLACMKGKRAHGIITVAAAFGYFFLLIKYIMPMSGSMILTYDLKNFQGRGGSLGGIGTLLIRNPAALADILFGTKDKINTCFNLLYPLLFLPCLTPALLLVLAPLFPLFLHSTGQSADFVKLHYHYAAPVLPFVYIALIFGFSNAARVIGKRWREAFVWAACVVLLFLNGGNYRTRPVTSEDLTSIAWAKKLPPGLNVVTHGHLLPYIGYRQYNYYLAAVWESPDHPEHGAYANADFYLIDLTVNPYPMDEKFLRDKIAALSQRPDYTLVESDGKRYLFKRTADSPRNVEGPQGPAESSHDIH